MSTSPKRLAVLASAALAFAGLTVLAPPAQAAGSRPRHQRGLRRRRWRRCDLQRRLRRAVQPDRQPGSTWTACTSTTARRPAPRAARRSRSPVRVPSRRATTSIQMSNTGAVRAPRCRRPTPARPASAWPQPGGRSSCSTSSTAITTTATWPASTASSTWSARPRPTSFETAAATAAATATQSLQRTRAPTPTTTAPSSRSLPPTPESTFAGGGGAPSRAPSPRSRATASSRPTPAINVTVRVS